jgi:hypothetical protein
MLGEFKWRLVNRVSRVLEPDEQNAVLGDFAETGTTGGKALRDLFSLVVRRQAGLYKDWRPWVALVGLAGPLGMLFYSGALGSLLGLSLWTQWQYQSRYESGLTTSEDLIFFICQSIALIFCSWTSGFALASLSRRTVWMLKTVLYFGWGALLIGMLQAVVLAALHGGVLHLLFRLSPSFLLAAALCPLPVGLGMRQGRAAGMLSVRTAILLAAATPITIVLAAWTNGWQQTALVNWSEGQLQAAPVWPKQLLPIALAAWPAVYLVSLTRFQRAAYQLRSL